jgi:thiamine kinase-like enzyme
MHPDYRYNLEEIAEQFAIEGDFISAEPYGTGHINETFASQFRTPNGIRRYVHQRLNHLVFKQPQQVMENAIRVTQHIRQKILAAGGDSERQCLTIIPTRQGNSFCQAEDGSYWRSYLLIENARTYDVAQNLGQVYAAAKAFGLFQHRLADLPGDRLHETIPDFHFTPHRFRNFISAANEDSCNRGKSVSKEIDFILQREPDTRVITDLMSSGDIPERVTHNDTKLNNVMLDDSTGEGVCVIDLDTTMPGSVLYDFGDMVRSGATTAEEDEVDLSKVNLNYELFDRLAQGYIETARDFLVPAEWEYLAFAGKLITLEQAIRFLADYLSGDIYYKIHQPEHNLIRARTQIKLVADMEAHMDSLRAIISRYRSVKTIRKESR